MTLFRNSLLALTAVLLCSFIPTHTELKDDLIGTWVQIEYLDNGILFEKQAGFAKDKPGVSFNADGTIVKRQNAGWCGTPPISYANNNGTWRQTSDSTLTVNYSYWGGTAEENWLIVEVDDRELVLQRLEVRREKKEGEFSPH